MFIAQRAFTLIEILLAIALLGLLSAALVSGAIRVVGQQPAAPEEVFWTSVHAARRTALRAETDAWLSFDEKERRFVVGVAGTADQFFPVPGARELTIDLLQAGADGGSALVGGQLVNTQTITAVTFHADGTCDPFRAQFRLTGPARVLAIDPWTCAPVLVASK